MKVWLQLDAPTTGWVCFRLLCCCLPVCVACGRAGRYNDSVVAQLPLTWTVCGERWGDQPCSAARSGLPALCNYATSDPCPCVGLPPLLQDAFCSAFRRSSPDFQTRYGYEVDAPNKANMKICSNQVRQACLDP